MVIIEIPKPIYTIATYLPKLVTGTISPYPTVVTVATHHHKASSKDFISELGSLDYTPYIKKVPNRTTITETINNFVIVSITRLYQGYLLSLLLN